MFGVSEAVDGGGCCPLVDSMIGSPVSLSNPLDFPSSAGHSELQMETLPVTSCSQNKFQLILKLKGLAPDSVNFHDQL